MTKNSSSSKIRKKPSTSSLQSSKPDGRCIPKLGLQKDLRDFVALCLSKRVEFIVVGGYAIALHGAPLFTNHIDLFVRISPENADKIECVPRELNVSREDVSREDLLTPQQVVQLGRLPNRVDLLTSIDGVQWEEAWESRSKWSFPVSNVGRLEKSS